MNHPKVCFATLLLAVALGAQEAPRKSDVPIIKQAPGSDEAKGDRPDLRRDFDLMWFGGEPSAQYLDYKKARAKEEMERWAQTLPGSKGDLPAIPGGLAAWTNLGPKKSTFSVYSGPAPTYPDVDAGRPAEVGILTHPNNPQILYLATSGGGLWKTTNADLSTSGDWTWTPLTDSLPNASTTGNVSIGAVAMSPADPETLFLALGDSFDAAGRGFYKSVNGGTTWSELGAAGTTTRVHILLVLDANTILVGGNAGMWRSSNGGASFSNLSLGGSATGDIWSIQRVGSSAVNLVATRKSGTTGTFWYSSDGGASWFQATLDGLASGQNPGRATVNSSLSSSTFVYAIAEKTSDPDDYFARGVFKSTDAGHNWTFIPAPTTTGSLFTPNNNPAWGASGGTGDGGQSFYNHCLAVDPDDASKLFVAANLSLYRSTDGGATWTQMTSWNSTNVPYAHADFHTNAWSKTGPKTLFVGNDGGLCVVRDPFRATPPFTTNPNDFATVDLAFVDNRRNRGITSHLTYHVGSSIAASPTDTRNRITLGLQDLSSRVRVDEGSGLRNSSTWNDPTGTGDGFGTLINSANGDKMMVSSYNARPKRSTDGGTNWSSASSGITGSAPFHTLLFPGRTDATGNTLFTSTNLVIYKSTDWAATAWAPLSMTGFTGTIIRNFNTSASNGNALAIAANSGNVWVTSNGGTTWTNPAGGDITGGSLNLSYVWFDTTNDQVIYAASVLQGAGSHLWKSVNGGTSFTPIDVSNGFPFGIPVHVIQNDPSTANRLLAGTDFGVYISENGGTTWVRYGVGLPMVATRDIYIAPDGSFVRAATFGRGIWEISAPAAPGPTITTQPGNQAVTVGQTATFNVVATGSGTLSYQWKKGVANVGSNSSSYTTPPTVLGDNGSSFTVSVTDATGTTPSNPAILTVNSGGGDTTTQLLLNPGFESGNTIWATSNNQVINPSSEVGMQVRNGTWGVWLIGYGTVHTDTLSQDVALSAGSTHIELNFWLKIGTNETGGVANDTLTVQIRNTSGGVLGTLTTLSNLDAPAYTTWVKKSWDVTQYKGQTIRVYLEGVENASLGTSFFVDDFELNATTVTATAPTITVQPLSQPVTVGQNASFTVVATGTAPLAYQWRRNGTNIGGATNATYTLLATMADNGAQYSVVVSNGSGSATSANATLTVNPKSGDLNGDGQANVLDLAAFIAAYSGSGVPTSNPAADLDGDGDCDDADLALLLAGI